MDGRLGSGEIELDKLPPHFFHRYPFCFVRLWMIFVMSAVEARPRAPSKLFCAQSRDIDEKKPVRHRRSRLYWFIGLCRLVHCWRIDFHKGQDYKNLRKTRKGLGTLLGQSEQRGRDPGRSIPNPDPLNASVNVAVTLPRSL